MIYRVHVTESATADAEAAYEWIAEREPDVAVRWFNGLADAVDSLESLPERCPLAPESKKAGHRIRQLLYGRRRNVYRILFLVRRREVLVLHIRHSARGTMLPNEIGLPPE